MSTRDGESMATEYRPTLGQRTWVVAMGVALRASRDEDRRWRVTGVRGHDGVWHYIPRATVSDYLMRAFR